MQQLIHHMTMRGVMIIFFAPHHLCIKALQGVEVPAPDSLTVPDSRRMRMRLIPPGVFLFIQPPAIALHLLRRIEQFYL